MITLDTPRKPTFATTVPPSLAEHLKRIYAITPHRNDARYFAWGAHLLGEERAAQLDALREPLFTDNPPAEALLAFYEFIAAADVAQVVHSMKADAIRVSGDWITSRLTGHRILDVGCHIGYLSTWYAITHPEIRITGIDCSPAAIAEATRIAADLGVTNIDFQTVDATTFNPGATYDQVIDTQGLLNGDEAINSLSRK